MEPNESTSRTDPLVQSDEEALDALIDSYAAQLRAGETPAIEEYLARNPELHEEVAEVLCLLNLLQDCKEGSESQDAEGQRSAREELPHIPGYKIEREIGRGGMGVVYEAWDEKLGRRVALKILPDQSKMMPTAVERFAREARAAAALQHPHIVPVYGVGEDQGQRFYMMQYIEGRSLDQVLVRVKRCQETQELPLEESPDKRPSGDSSTSAAGKRYARAVAALGLQAAEALAYAHDRGVLHRDIKPSNLLLDKKGTLWVTDFGLAKLEGVDSVTATGEVLGTFRYMAPERFSGESLPAGDLYSLGLTLYELLAGTPAFDESDRTRLVQRILSERPPALRTLKPGIPRDLERIVEKCIAKEPSHRYGAATELVEDLRLFLKRKPLRWARRPPWTSRAGLWCRRNPLVTVLTCCILALAALLLLSPGRDPERTPEAGKSTEETPASRLFEPVKTVAPSPEGSNIIGAEVADFDGDGLRDIVALSIDAERATVLIQDDKRSFRPLPSVEVTSKPAILLSLDADGDGRTDVVTANRGSGDVAILRNESGGRLRLIGRVALGFPPFGLVAMHLNDDKRIDLVAAGGNESLRCLENIGSGNFRAGDPIRMEARPSALAGGEFFGNERPHLAVIDSDASRLSLVPWSLQGPAGTEVRVHLPTLPVSVAAADFNKDGCVDLAIASYRGEKITIVSSTGKADAVTTKTFPAGRTPISVAAADVDGDKLADIIVANELEEGVSVLKNLGDDKFELLGLCTTDGYPCAVRVADLDGDQLPDVVVANGRANTVGVLWHRP